MLKRWQNLLIILFITSFYPCFAQELVKGQVLDNETKQTLPFATIKMADSKQGLITDMNGKFEISINNNVSYLEICYLGYNSYMLKLPVVGEQKIFLKPKEGGLSEVVVKPPYEKMRRIINAAIATRDIHNPDKYDWYQCHVYYKMIADIKVSDSFFAKVKDTTFKDPQLKAILTDQHLMMSETYSIRTWEKPQKLQEQVLATKLSGFKKSMFTSLVTDILPFHAYSDFITLNSKEYHNPISKGFEQHYDFNLVDEIVQGKDTVWILSFRPKKGKNELNGTVYINSDEFAIAHIIAKAQNEQFHNSVSIEQQYKKDNGQWFPNQLNYVIEIQQKTKDSLPYKIQMNGNSIIDSITYMKDNSFHFDKAHTVKVEAHADELSDSVWANYRPIHINKEEMRTYEFMDSLLQSVHFDRYMSYLEKLPEGKLPIGPIDMDLMRLYTYNKYEGNCLGLGLQTNEKVIKHLSIGGWGRYGFGDYQWKYGAFAEAYLDRYKEFVAKIAYDNDVHEPGRLQVNRELDKGDNYLRSLVINRVDHVESYTASIKKRFGYWNIELIGRQENITPKYNYTLKYDGVNYTQFTANELTLNLRYLFAERTAPIFGKYVPLGSKYPVVYGRLIEGVLKSSDMQINYTQALAAMSWQKHLNRIGIEKFLIQVGKSWSGKPLPLSKLFAGNGMAFDNSYFGYYAFGNLMTALPYQFYTDQYLLASWKHDFDWKFYSIKFLKGQYSSSPFMSLVHNMLIGTMDHMDVHRNIAFAVPDNAYHESGIMLNNIIGLKYFNVAYLNFGAGIFYHWTSDLDVNKNGRVAIGMNFEF
ncbi:MAG: DUF5686 family protein [Bacteroidota bacterium]